MPDLLWIPELPIIQTVSFSTDVLESYDGSEQRVARITQPRQALEMKYQFDTGKQIRQFRTELFRNLSSVWRVPLWWDPDELDTEASFGAGSLSGDFAFSNILVGDTIILVRPEIVDVGDFDIHDVLTKTDTTITLDGTTLNEPYPVGTFLFRMVNMRIRPTPGFARHHDAIEEFRVEFDFDSLIDLGGEGTGGSPTYFQSDDPVAFQLLVKRSLASSPLTISMDDASERLDFGQGFRQFSAVDELSFLEARHFLISTREELRDWEKFFKVIMGAREPFYLPTYRVDLLHQIQPFGPNWQNIDVADESFNEADTLDYPGQWFLSAAHKSLRFDTNLGEQYREVILAKDNGDGTVSLAFDSGLLPNSVISEISFLERVRLAADVIRFEHHGLWPGNSSRISFVTRTIQR